MKTVFTFFAICISFCLLFSSCGVNSFIVKRHYMPGYYINMAGNKHSISPSKEEEKTVEIKRIPALNYPGNRVKQTTMTIHPNQVIKTNPITYGSATGKNRTIHYSQSYGKQLLAAKNDVSEAPVLRTGIFLPEATIAQEDSSEHAALSLLWIVILVILILWLIGILAGGLGLGVLINLLLVIALVLLILWLLRIL